MFCNKCGAVLRGHERFCPKCGTEVVQKQKNIEENEMTSIDRREVVEKASKRIKAKVILLVVVVILAVIGLVFFLNEKKKEKEYNELITSGDSLMNEGSYEEALNAYSQALKYDDKDKNLYIKLAKSAYKSDEDIGYIKALEYYEKILEMDEADIDAYKGMVQLSMSSGYMEEVEQLCAEAVKKVKDEEKEFFQSVSEKCAQYRKYNKYYDFVFEKIDNSGVKSSDGRLTIYGTCFMEMVDFDKDEMEEIVIARSTLSDYNSSIEDMVLEVWEYNGNDFELIFEGMPYCSVEGNCDIFILDDGEKCYLQAGDSHDGDISKKLYKHVEGSMELIDTSEIQVKDTKTYRVFGAKDAVDNGNVAEAYATKDLLRYKLNYLSHCARKAVEAMILLEGDIAGLVEPGQYYYEDDELFVGLLSYLSEEKEPEIRVISGVKNTFDYNRQNFDVIFKWNPDTKTYIHDAENEPTYFLSVSVGEDGNVEMLLEHKSDFMDMEPILGTLETVEKW